jgi:hypothetical protein
MSLAGTEIGDHHDCDNDAESQGEPELSPTVDDHGGEAKCQANNDTPGEDRTDVLSGFCKSRADLGCPRLGDGKRENRIEEEAAGGERHDHQQHESEKRSP